MNARDVLKSIGFALLASIHGFSRLGNYHQNCHSERSLRSEESLLNCAKERSLAKKQE
jgi:hypothetical protein